MAVMYFVLFSCFVVLSAGYSAPPAPPPQLCNQNEVLSCVHDCPPERTCRNRGIAFRCREPTKKCEYKCICKPGYYRNAIGDCITEKQCDQCSGPNEFFSCGTECDNECDTSAAGNRTNCPIINVMCNPKCYCEDGFARNAKRECIPVEQCPKRCSGPNEEYVKCKKTCPSQLCRSLAAFYRCPVPIVCVPGCQCKPGFLRIESNSPCRPTCDCPEIMNSPACVKKCK